MDATEIGFLIILIFSPWILTTTWIMGGLTRDYIWHRWGFDLLRTR